MLPSNPIQLSPTKGALPLILHGRGVLVPSPLSSAIIQTPTNVIHVNSRLLSSSRVSRSESPQHHQMQHQITQKKSFQFPNQQPEWIINQIPPLHASSLVSTIRQHSHDLPPNKQQLFLQTIPDSSSITLNSDHKPAGNTLFPSKPNKSQFIGSLKSSLGQITSQQNVAGAGTAASLTSSQDELVWKEFYPNEGSNSSKIEAFSVELKRQSNEIIEKSSEISRLRQQITRLEGEQRSTVSQLKQTSEQLSTSESKRQQLYTTIDSLQAQLTTSLLSEQTLKSESIHLTYKLNEILEENKRLIDIFESVSSDKLLAENEVREKERHAVQLHHQDQEAIAARADVIRCLEQDNLMWADRFKDLEISRLTATINNERMEIQLIELNEDLERTKQSHGQLEQELTLANVSINAHEQRVQQLEELINQQKQQLQSFKQQIVELENLNRTKDSDKESLTSNHRIEKDKWIIQEDSFRTQIDKYNSEIVLFQSVEKEFISCKAELNEERKKAKEQFIKTNSLESYVNQLLEANQQLRKKAIEYEEQMNAVIIKEQEMTLQIQQMKISIEEQQRNYESKVQQNQALVSSNKEIFDYNEEIAAKLARIEDESKKIILATEQNRGEIELRLKDVLRENERLSAIHENSALQQSTINDELNMKKKLLVQYAKENESLRQQVIDGMAAQDMLEKQTTHNAELLEAVRVKERELLQLKNGLQRSFPDNHRDDNRNNKQQEQLFSQIQAENQRLSEENQRLFHLLELRKREIEMLKSK